MGILSSLENAAEAAGEMLGFDKKEETTEQKVEAPDNAAAAQVGGGIDMAKLEPEAETVQAAAAAQTYTVQSGDTLSKISQRYYGNAHDYMKIFNANRDKLNDPDEIQIGQELTIPTE